MFFFFIFLGGCFEIYFLTNDNVFNVARMIGIIQNEVGSDGLDNLFFHFQRY
jgi:hypothetical protein